MQQWEYFDFSHTPGSRYEPGISENLRVLGADGWELVSVVVLHDSGTQIFYLKRPMPQIPPSEKIFNEVKNEDKSSKQWYKPGSVDT